MKKLNKYIMLFVAALALVGCVDDVTETPSMEAQAGDEVQFGLTLPSARTIYGPEANNAFPIYWAEDDKVQIYSPECLEGRNNAEYKVILPTGSATPNYAMDLQITGANGVQWGEATTANFYSVYPSSGAKFEGTGDNVSVTMNIASEQNVVAMRDDNSSIYYAADMTNVIMYAQKVGAEAGKTVDLQYNPYSTVLEFALSVPEDAAGSIKVSDITLEANTDISGSFKLSFDSEGKKVPTVAVAGENGKTINMDFSVMPELKAGSTTLKAKMALMPISGVKTLEGWKVKVTVINGDGSEGTFVRTFPATSTGLVAGKVHKIQLPALEAEKEWKYEPQNWMKNLPKYQNIYLTELSIPGAWYAGQKTSDGYQDTTDFTAMWNAGVRAFGVECRAFTARSGILGLGNISESAPTRIVLSGTGSDKNNAYTSSTIPEQVYISEIISKVATAVSGTNEFAVIVLNYAYGGDGGYRALDYQNFLKLIGGEITKSGATNIVTDINSSTHIHDVMNKVIIKVNVDGRVNYDSGSAINAMFSATPLFTDLTPSSIYFSEMVSRSWTAANDYSYGVDYSVLKNKYTWCFTNANRTQLDSGTDANLPKYADRKSALKAMTDHSREIYDESDHNVWFYFNAGGTQSTKIDDGGDPEAFAKEMNPWLYDLITLKTYGGTDSNGNIVTPDASPLGIVMFNKCTSGPTTENDPSTDVCKGKAIIKAIIEMNNKCKLKKSPNIYNSTNDDNQTDEEEEGA